MHRGLPKIRRPLFRFWPGSRTLWTAMVLYDARIVVFTLTRQESGELAMTATRSSASRGIDGGRIVNSRKAGETMGDLLQSVAGEVGARQRRVLVGLDTPPLVMTPKHWTSDSCINVPCSETTYRRTLENIVRESTVDGQSFVDIMPLRIEMDDRSVEDPCGLTGQMHITSVFVSLSNQSKQDVERCLARSRYRVEAFYSGFLNLCSAFCELAEEEECVLLVDLKCNSTDLVLFQGDQPVALKCIRIGLDRALTRTFASLLNVSPGNARRLLAKYYACGDEQVEVFEGDEQHGGSGLKQWEFHEIVVAQLKNLLSMEGGIGAWLTKTCRELQAAPTRLVITGEGMRIPGIADLFADRFNIRSEVTAYRADECIPPTAYGMARCVARDLGLPLSSAT